MYLEIPDVSALSIKMVEARVNGIAYLVPEDVILGRSQSVTKSQAIESHLFRFKIIAFKSLPKGYVVEIQEVVANAADTWISSNGLSRISAEDADAVIASSTYKLHRQVRLRALAGETTVVEIAKDNPARLRQGRFTEIDSRTRDLIDQGFSFQDLTFSLSDKAQTTYLGMFLSRDLLSYPVVVSTMDDLDFLSLADSTDVQEFYLAGVSALRGILDTGTALKKSVADAATEAEVLAVTDNR